MIQPAAVWRGRLPEAVVQKQDVSTGLIRLATGIEDTQDLLSDIEQAPQKVQLSLSTESGLRPVWPRP